MRRPGIGTQIGVAFAVVAAATALLTAGFVFLAWQNAFESYVAERVRRDAGVLADMASSVYLNGSWRAAGLVEIARIGAQSGLRIQVIDSGGNLLVDNADLFAGTMMPGLGSMMGTRRLRGNSGPMTPPVVRQPIEYNGEVVGSVRVASSSPGSFLTDRDLQFRSASLLGVAAAAVLAVVLAGLGGFVYARGFARPIERVTRTARELRGGDRGARSGLTGNDEVGELGRTLDEMADAIEVERAFERRLTADVAHELRTPLQALQATVEAMQDGVLPADPEHLQVVRDETIRLARLADSILELSRLENRSVEFRMSSTDMAVPLRRAVETHRALMEQLGITLEEEIDDGVFVMADEDRLTQAFGNLLSNAAAYTPDGGRVSVRVAISDGAAVASVSDTGIGVAEADREHVFSRFWRGDEARARSSKGFGVGLAVVREIVEVHGGSVWFEENPGGHGTTFKVSIPLEGASPAVM